MARKGELFGGLTVALITPFDNGKVDENALTPPWWRNQITESIDSSAQRVDTGVNELMRMAVANSAKVSVDGPAAWARPHSCRSRVWRKTWRRECHRVVISRLGRVASFICL